MGEKKCIYTGKDSRFKDNVLPRNILTEEGLHNWANQAPISEEYKKDKTGRMPTELEMQANEVFHLLELAKLRVEYYQAILNSVRDRITVEFVPVKEEVKREENKPTRQDKQVKKMIHEHNLLKEQDKILEQVIKKRKSMWEE